MTVRLPSLVLAALLAALMLPATAEAKRRVPFGFFGMAWDKSATHVPKRVRTEEWSLMARSGVESVRASFNWNATQPYITSSVNFRPTDEIVFQAARHGMRVLPVVEIAPEWARRYPDRRASPPADVDDYASLLTDLIYRYGPEGAFWEEHPRLPFRPIHEWQIWNEPELTCCWDVPPGAPDAWPGGYVRLLAAAYRAVKEADPHGLVVMGGLAEDSWNRLRQFYRAGGGRWFDVVAFHLYSGSGRNTGLTARRVRDVMRRYGDRRKPLYATEVGCPAARGRLGVYHPLVTTDRGMAHCLSGIYHGLARNRRRLRLGRVYWYTWGTNYSGSSLFDYSGLRAWSRSRRQFASKPALGRYVRAARRYEGCAKTATGHCKRRHRRRR